MRDSTDIIEVLYERDYDDDSLEVYLEWYTHCSQFYRNRRIHVDDSPYKLEELRPDTYENPLFLLDDVFFRFFLGYDYSDTSADDFCEKVVFYAISKGGFEQNNDYININGKIWASLPLINTLMKYSIEYSIGNDLYNDHTFYMIEHGI